MTCIVGFIDKPNRKMYLGGDSAGVGGLHIRSRKDTKVFQKGEMLFGYTSSFRMGQLLRFKLNIPTIGEAQNVYEYMCTDFIDAVRQCLKENGYTKVDNNQEEIGIFIVAFKGRLFQIDDDLQVAEHNYSYASCGCGEVYALGAIRAIDFHSRHEIGGEKLVEISLKVAEEFSAGVRNPFNIISLSY